MLDMGARGKTLDCLIGKLIFIGLVIFVCQVPVELQASALVSFWCCFNWCTYDLEDLSLAWGVDTLNAEQLLSLSAQRVYSHPFRT